MLVLIVEDEHSLSDIYKISFTHAGFQVELAGDGIECMNKLQNSKPDIILMDIMMPNMNGLDALKKIKEDEKTKNIPVVMITNLAENTQEARALSLGARAYLVKSRYLPMQIVDEVKNILSTTSQTVQ